MPDSTQLDSLRPGTQLNGIYEIDRLVASGGMGEVYKGHSIQTGHDVAIKVIRHEFANNELVRSLFRNEASSLHNLHHEAIVRYFIFAVDPTLGRAYLAMDFVEGESLSQMLRRGPMPVETVARLAARIAGGLHAAHKQGITHRDISPDNIIIQGDDVGQAMIIDFGIARATRAGEETIVDTGFAGKYNYVSPEQLGEYGGDVTPKSDIYSLGLVVAAALRGAPIDMSGRPVEVITKRRTVPPLDDIDPRARPILTRMLQPSPADRPDSMIDLARALETLARPPEKGPREDSDTTKKERPRFGLLHAGLAVVFLAAIGIGTGAYYLWPKPGPEPQAAPPRTEPAKEPVVAAPTPTPPPPPPAPPPTLATRVERITNYLADYRGGSCVHIVPGTITGTSATIDGYALKATPFDELDRAFLAEFGFEAQIRAMIIKPAQCPVLSFLDRVQSDPQLAPRIEIPHSLLRAGTALSGSVSGTGTRKLELLLVSVDGSVENVTRFLRPGVAKITFEIPLAKPSIPGEPRLLLAMSSAEPLTALNEAGALPSDTFFEKLLADRRLTAQTLGTALGYFQVE
jgi:serine/threonine protein kinase